MSYYHKKAPKKNLPLVIYGQDAHQVQQVQKNLPKLMILVVGETARAESFSLNGYAKNTNPELSKQDIFNFSQVSSCGTATAVSVPCMFSGMPRVDYDEQLASRSEEHTSELQSRDSISYAVFCLKKNFFNDTATTEIYTY